MIQPSRVLPSNAPPLRDENVHQASRVLQEHSGNRQQNDFGLAFDFDHKYPSNVLTENNYPPHFPRPHQQALHGLPQPYGQQPHHLHIQHRQSWRYGYGRGNRPEDEARIRFEADRLYHRFRKSDQYIKYRQRQTKDDKGTGEQKWPDHLEKAFFRALVQYPPMGRRKMLHKDKQRGRNELIADCIEELTGESRGRKQVSSHIQVLKPFVEGDPLIMKWLSKEDMYGPTGRLHRGPSSFAGGRSMSNYPVTEPPQTARNAMTTMLRNDLHGLQKLKSSLDVFEPIDFQMFIQRKYQVAKDKDEAERLHTYTDSFDNPLGPNVQLQDFQTFTQEFPLLASMHARRPLDCIVLDAEASLTFPSETFKRGEGQASASVIELGIHFQCSSRHFPPTMRDAAVQVIVNNIFYENGVPWHEDSGPSEALFEAYGRTGLVVTPVKFGSEFWAKTLGRLAARLLDTSKDHRDEVAASLRGISAVQEIIAESEHSCERLMVIHWKFRYSTSTKGRASWRRLLLPNQSPDYLKNERADSIFDCSTPLIDTSGTQQHQQHSQPILQSPFEYDSGSGSALSSATWPTFSSDGSFVNQPPGSTDFSTDNSFDFHAGDINISYDPNLTFDTTFDSSAFDFDTTTADLNADSVMQDYSQPWYPDYTAGIDEHSSVHTNDAYPDMTGNSTAYHGCGGEYDQGTLIEANDQQAYGGAGPDVVKDEDALIALADASFIASAMTAKHEPV